MKLLVFVCGLLIFPVGGWSADLRLGIIGTDTSHAVAFARVLNDAAAPNHVGAAQITMAFKGGSPDIEESSSRVEKYAAELATKWHVRFVGRIAEMCESVDGLLLESVDGRAHLEQAREAIKCGKPLFIDKPLSSSLAGAQEIARGAREARVPWFSASTLRFSDINSLKREALNGAIVWGPGPIEPHQELDLSWYCIHAAEMLFTLMGSGCAEVTRTGSEGADVVTCRWQDGRLGTMRIDRPYSKFGAVVFRSQNRVEALADIKVDYVPLVREIVRFMETRVPPVSNEETLEIFRFLDAAQRSKVNGGAEIKMSPQQVN